MEDSVISNLKRLSCSVKVPLDNLQGWVVCQGWLLHG